MMVGNGGLDFYLVVFVKDNVFVYLIQNVGECISGCLWFIKQGFLFFMVGIFFLYEYCYLGFVVVVEIYCVMLLFDVF